MKIINKAFDKLYGECKDEIDYIKSTSIASIIIVGAIYLFLLILEFIFSG